MDPQRLPNADPENSWKLADGGELPCGEEDNNERYRTVTMIRNLQAELKDALENQHKLTEATIRLGNENSALTEKVAQLEARLASRATEDGVALDTIIDAFTMDERNARHSAEISASDELYELLCVHAGTLASTLAKISGSTRRYGSIPSRDSSVIPQSVVPVEGEPILTFEEIEFPNPDPSGGTPNNNSGIGTRPTGIDLGLTPGSAAGSAGQASPALLSFPGFSAASDPGDGQVNLTTGVRRQDRRPPLGGDSSTQQVRPENADDDDSGDEELFQLRVELDVTEQNLAATQAQLQAFVQALAHEKSKNTELIAVLDRLGLGSPPFPIELLAAAASQPLRQFLTPLQHSGPNSIRSNPGFGSGSQDAVNSWFGSRSGSAAGSATVPGANNNGGSTPPMQPSPLLKRTVQLLVHRSGPVAVPREVVACAERYCAEPMMVVVVPEKKKGIPAPATVFMDIVMPAVPGVSPPKPSLRLASPEECCTGTYELAMLAGVTRGKAASHTGLEKLLTKRDGHQKLRCPKLPNNVAHLIGVGASATLTQQQQQVFQPEDNAITLEFSTSRSSDKGKFVAIVFSEDMAAKAWYDWLTFLHRAVSR